MGKVITLMLQKGGVGKTTISATLAKMLHMSGYKVLGIDIDSQSHFTSYVMDIDDTKQDASNSFADQNLFNAFLDGDLTDHILSFKEGFDIVPGSSQVVDTNAMFEERDDDKQTYLRDMLEEIKDDYDYIVIDSPPDFKNLEIASIVASDYILIVANPDLKTSGEVFKMIESKLPVIKNLYNPTLEIAGILLNKVSHNQKNHRMYRNLLIEHYPDLVLKGYVKNKVIVENILNTGFDGMSEFEEYESLSEFRRVFLDLGDRIGAEFKFPKKPILTIEEKTKNKNTRQQTLENKQKYFFNFSE